MAQFLANKIQDNYLGRWPMTTSSFKTARTAYLSLEFNGFLSQMRNLQTLCDLVEVIITNTFF